MNCPLIYHSDAAGNDMIGSSGLFWPENSDEFAPVPMSLIFINLNKLAA
jgi:hypothetical protein